MVKIAISLFISGLLFGAGPCLASCGPLLTTYIAASKKNIPASIITYIWFSFSRIAVYIALSLIIFFFGEFALARLSGSWLNYLIVAAGLTIIFIGVGVIFNKKLEFSLPPILMGAAVGILPCGPLLAVLSYIGLVSKAWQESLLYGLSFGLGTLLSPLVLLSVFSGWLGNWLKSNRYYRIFRFTCGMIIILLGLNLLRRAF